MLKDLEELISIVRDRKKNPKNSSYTNKLLSDRKLSIDKIKEELFELIESVEKNSNKVHETADLLYHLIVLLENSNIKIEDVMSELKKEKKLMSYDNNNIFAKILGEKYPVKKFMKINLYYRFMILTHKKIHALVIPKGSYKDLDDFVEKAKEIEIIELFKGINHVAKILKVSNVDGGYRTLTNIGSNGGQEVPHLHFHIFGGEKIGKMVS